LGHGTRELALDPPRGFPLRDRSPFKIAGDIGGISTFGDALHDRVGTSSQFVGHGTDGLIVDPALLSQAVVEGGELEVTSSSVVSGKEQVLLEEPWTGFSQLLSGVVALAGGLVAGNQGHIAAEATDVGETVHRTGLAKHARSDDQAEARYALEHPLGIKLFAEGCDEFLELLDLDLLGFQEIELHADFELDLVEVEEGSTAIALSFQETGPGDGGSEDLLRPLGIKEAMIPGLQKSVEPLLAQANDSARIDIPAQKRPVGIQELLVAQCLH
jgi:hypothetical protein